MSTESSLSARTLGDSRLGGSEGEFCPSRVRQRDHSDGPVETDRTVIWLCRQPVVGEVGIDLCACRPVSVLQAPLFDQLTNGQGFWLVELRPLAGLLKSGEALACSLGSLLRRGVVRRHIIGDRPEQPLPQFMQRRSVFAKPPHGPTGDGSHLGDRCRSSRWCVELASICEPQPAPFANYCLVGYRADTLTAIKGVAPFEKISINQIGDAYPPSVDQKLSA